MAGPCRPFLFVEPLCIASFPKMVKIPQGYTAPISEWGAYQNQTRCIASLRGKNFSKIIFHSNLLFFETAFNLVGVYVKHKPRLLSSFNFTLNHLLTKQIY